MEQKVARNSRSLKAMEIGVVDARPMAADECEVLIAQQNVATGLLVVELLPHDGDARMVIVFLLLLKLQTKLNIILFILFFADR
jgi:hypothetical protein